MAEYCNDGRFKIRRTGPWGAVDHYEPNGLKKLGIAVPQISPQELRQKWGFTRPLIGLGEYSQYVNTYGYMSSDLLVAIDRVNPGATIDSCPGVVEFWADEPYTNSGWAMDDIINVANYVHSRGKKFGVGEQGSLLMYPSTAKTYFENHVAPLLDYITYTNYQNISASSGDNDQRDTWTALRGNYSSKFDRVWISSVKDSREYSSLGDEYPNLLGHASNLGIDIALFYAGGGLDYSGAGTQRQLEAFCDAAWRQGWLRKFVKQVEQVWCCLTTTYYFDDCELISTTETGVVMEV